MAQEKLIGLNPRIFFSLYYIYVHRKMPWRLSKTWKIYYGATNLSFLYKNAHNSVYIAEDISIYLFQLVSSYFPIFFFWLFFFSLRKMSKDIYLIKTCIQFCWYKWLYLWKTKNCENILFSCDFSHIIESIKVFVYVQFYLD